MTPLEAMYPNRCYDCLAACDHSTVLCDRCEATYAQARNRGPKAGDSE